MKKIIELTDEIKKLLYVKNNFDNKDMDSYENNNNVGYITITGSRFLCGVVGELGCPTFSTYDKAFQHLKKMLCTKK